MRGAREIDEGRRTVAVRWSEAIELNKADGPFSTVWHESLYLKPCEGILTECLPLFTLQRACLLAPCKLFS